MSNPPVCPPLCSPRGRSSSRSTPTAISAPSPMPMRPSQPSSAAPLSVIQTPRSAARRPATTSRLSSGGISIGFHCFFTVFRLFFDYFATEFGSILTHSGTAVGERLQSPTAVTLVFEPVDAQPGALLGPFLHKHFTQNSVLGPFAYKWPSFSGLFWLILADFGSILGVGVGFTPTETIQMEAQVWQSELERNFGNDARAESTLKSSPLWKQDSQRVREKS